MDGDRLSENPKVLVGVIEAGQHFVDDPLIDTPRTWPIISGKLSYITMFRICGVTARQCQVWLAVQVDSPA